MSKKKIKYEIEVVNKVYTNDEMNKMPNCEMADWVIKNGGELSREWLLHLKRKYARYYKRKEWERFMERYNKMLISTGKRTVRV